MTGKERVLSAIKRQPADRIPIYDSFWLDTLSRWRSEGMPDDVEPADLFDFDIHIMGLDTSPRFTPELLQDDGFRSSKRKIPLALGKDVYGNTVIGDLAAMPHCLVAGATGAGKSVCINSIITSILYKFGPDELRFIMIDPKVVEMQVYSKLPHLVVPVVTDPRKVVGALNWCVNEFANLREFNYSVEFQLDLFLCESQYRSIYIDIFSSGQDGVKPCSQFNQGPNPPTHGDPSLVRLYQTIKHLKQCALTGAVGSDQAQTFAAF